MKLAYSPEIQVRSPMLVDLVENPLGKERQHVYALMGVVERIVSE
jgi:hypothetical protein